MKNFSGVIILAAIETSRAGLRVTS